MSASDERLTRERRANDRHLTLYRVGLIAVDGQRDLCLIKNISADGMKLRVYGEVTVGQRLVVEMKGGRGIPGRVIWVDGQDAGLLFDQSIDVVETLAVTPGEPLRRMPRIDVDADIAVREGSYLCTVLAHDISQGGLRVSSDDRLTLGAEVVVNLSGRKVIGVVRWIKDGNVGIAFNQLLPLPTLVDWLHEYRERRKTPSA